MGRPWSRRADLSAKPKPAQNPSFADCIRGVAEPETESGAMRVWEYRTRMHAYALMKEIDQHVAEAIERKLQVANERAVRIDLMREFIRAGHGRPPEYDFEKAVEMVLRETHKPKEEASNAPAEPA